jgi:hypothetical protein
MLQKNKYYHLNVQNKLRRKIEMWQNKFGWMKEQPKIDLMNNGTQNDVERLVRDLH